MIANIDFLNQTSQDWNTCSVYRNGKQPRVSRLLSGQYNGEPCSATGKITMLSIETNYALNFPNEDVETYNTNSGRHGESVAKQKVAEIQDVNSHQLSTITMKKRPFVAETECHSKIGASARTIGTLEKQPSSIESIDLTSGSMLPSVGSTIVAEIKLVGKRLVPFHDLSASIKRKKTEELEDISQDSRDDEGSHPSGVFIRRGTQDNTTYDADCSSASSDDDSVASLYSVKRNSRKYSTFSDDPFLVHLAHELKTYSMDQLRMECASRGLNSRRLTKYLMIALILETEKNGIAHSYLAALKKKYLNHASIELGFQPKKSKRDTATTVVIALKHRKNLLASCHGFSQHYCYE